MSEAPLLVECRGPVKTLKKSKTITIILDLNTPVIPVHNLRKPDGCQAKYCFNQSEYPVDTLRCKYCEIRPNYWTIPYLFLTLAVVFFLSGSCCRSRAVSVPCNVAVRVNLSA